MARSGPETDPPNRNQAQSAKAGLDKGDRQTESAKAGQGERDRRAGRSPQTRLVRGGELSRGGQSPIPPPIVRASTLLYDHAADMRTPGSVRYTYGLRATPTIDALTTAVSDLENAAGTVLLPSGAGAVSIAMMTVAQTGQTVFLPDNVYEPTRTFSDSVLARIGMDVHYYAPLDTAALAESVGEDTAAIFIEAPGSGTFEFPDIPAIVDIARSVGAATIMDNTWATPLIYKPLDHGIDLSVQAGTKYLGGHSDLLIGMIAANRAWWPRLRRTHWSFGNQAGTEEIWLTLRGMRTASLRLDRHEKSALEVAGWLAGRPEVANILHPAFPSCPGHDNWKRIFGRATGLFAFEFDGDRDQAERFADALQLVGLGFSWGGYASLAVIVDIDNRRTVHQWTGRPIVRLFVGLEDVADIIADLDQAFAKSAR